MDHAITVMDVLKVFGSVGLVFVGCVIIYAIISYAASGYDH